jgi:uncharacterized protein with NAD-binding domain and iron-sulfur cluster
MGDHGKHIAIVGYGSACLIILKMLQDLPKELRQGWRVTVYERREGLGGQWCAQPAILSWELSDNDVSSRLPDDAVQDPAKSVPLTG